MYGSSDVWTLRWFADMGVYQVVKVPMYGYVYTLPFLRSISFLTNLKNRYFSIFFYKTDAARKMFAAFLLLCFYHFLQIFSRKDTTNISYARNITQKTLKAALAEKISTFCNKIYPTNFVAL